MSTSLCLLTKMAADKCQPFRTNGSNRLSALGKKDPEADADKQAINEP